MKQPKHEPTPFTRGPLVVVDRGADGRLLVVDNRAKIADMQTFVFMRELKGGEPLPAHGSFKRTDCPRCKDGYAEFCKACDGEGERDCTCTDCGDDHTTTCEACDGGGGVLVCGLCDGNATVIAAKLNRDDPKIDVATLPMKAVSPEARVQP